MCNGWEVLGTGCACVSNANELQRSVKRKIMIKSIEDIAGKGKGVINERGRY